MKNIILLFICLISNTSIDAQLKIGDPLPNIYLPSYLKNEVRLLDYSGKILLVDFWASCVLPVEKQTKNLSICTVNIRHPN